MTIYHFTSAFLDQAVLDAARAIEQRFDNFWLVTSCKTALELLEKGRAGDSFLFDALAVDTGLEPVELYSILHRRAAGLAGKKGRNFKVVAPQRYSRSNLDPKGKAAKRKASLS
jgi:hypothetical protein